MPLPDSKAIRVPISSFSSSNSRHPYYRHEDVETEDSMSSTRGQYMDQPRYVGAGHSAGQHGKSLKQIAIQNSRRQSFHNQEGESWQGRPAENNDAGIRVVTDMSQFRHGTRPSPEDGNKGRYVDAAALKALEGSPSSASIGNFSWFSKEGGSSRAKSTKKLGPSPVAADSPAERPIVIGIAVPSDRVAEHQPSPQTAVIETPQAGNGYAHQRSYWSPDTEDGPSPGASSRACSSEHSRVSHRGGGGDERGSEAPAVPGIPARLKFKQPQPADLYDDEPGTPCTLFEEDGSSPMTHAMNGRRSLKPKAKVAVPIGFMETGVGPSRFWENDSNASSSALHDTNPFKQQQSSTRTSAALRDWWQDVNEKQSAPDIRAASSSTQTKPSAHATERYTAQSSTASTKSANMDHHATSTRPETHTDKARILYEENQVPHEEPPPYSPPPQTHPANHATILPPNHALHSASIPSPGPMTPNIPGTMTSQGAIGLADIPLTPRGLHGTVLPDRAVGTYVPDAHATNADGTRHRTERQRRRHEKEDIMARKMGGSWGGRGCVPLMGCFGGLTAPGREGRKKRRICLGIAGGLVAVIILVVVLLVVLLRKEGNESPTVEHSVWLNLTDFPPMPTGVLTVTPNLVKAITGCANSSAASTSWSCSTPKDRRNDASPGGFSPSQFIFQVQYDNSTQELWNVTQSVSTKATTSTTSPSHKSTSTHATRAATTTDDNKKLDVTAAASSIAREAGLARRDDNAVYDAGISPNPAPPSLSEQVFLGETTDEVMSEEKAGEPTPFYISFLSSVNSTVGPDVLSRRGVRLEDRDIGNGISGVPSNGTDPDNGQNGIGGFNLTDVLPPPELNPDGTGAPAHMMPQSFSQQPVRLFNRGLPTEHYGFYTYFNKTVYLSDIQRAVSADENGGARIEDAKFLVTWAEVRLRVQIWTRKGNSTLLLDESDNDNAAAATTTKAKTTAQPDTMPYPVTVNQDLHGGDSEKKGTWYYGVTKTQHIDRDLVKLLVVDRGYGGKLINPAGDADSLRYGGIDGGTGGCQCQWRNFEGLNADDDEDEG